MRKISQSFPAQVSYQLRYSLNVTDLCPIEISVQVHRQNAYETPGGKKLFTNVVASFRAKESYYKAVTTRYVICGNNLVQDGVQC